MTFDIIGTGNTAWFMGTRLVAAGHSCTGVYGRNAGRAVMLANELHTHTYSALTEVHDGSDCCIIAISDHAIAEVAAHLSFSKTVLCHTAGAVSMDVLTTSAIHTGVIWPVYSILKADIPQHRDIPFVWEANTHEARTTIHTLAESISDIRQELDSEKRKWLHLTAVLGNNFSNHLFSICEQLCAAQHIPFNTLYPIIRQTAERISTQSPRQLQTGPAKRHDSITIHEHLDMLTETPVLQEVYKVLSAAIENMYSSNAEEKGAKP